MNFFKITCLVLLSVCLSACSYFYSEEGLVKDTTYEYLNARQDKSLKVPSNLHHKRSVDYFKVPEIKDNANQAPIGRDIRLEAPAQLLDVKDNIRIKRESKNPAVYIKDDREFVWKAVIKLFEQNAITLSENENYVIKTDWIALKEKGLWLGVSGKEDVDDYRAKYKVSLSHGELPGEYQVDVKRITAEKLDDDTEKWVTIPARWQDSAEMLNLIIANYDILSIEREAEKRNAVIAGVEVQLARDDNDNAAILTSADQETVWNKLPKVLESLSFEVYDKDKRSYTYFVKHEPEEAGFFATLFDSEDDEYEELPLNTGEYQVTVITLVEKTAVVFRDAQGAPLDTATLTKLFPFLNKQFAKAQ